MAGITRLIPVVILFAVVGGAAWIGWQIYLYTQTLAERGQQSMAKRNIHLTREGGMRVGVKELKTEDYAQRTQDYLVKAWNLSTWPEYRSRFWNKEAQQGAGGKGGDKTYAAAAAEGTGKRPGVARMGSSGVKKA